MIGHIDTESGPLWVKGNPDYIQSISWSPLDGTKHHGELKWIMSALKSYFDGSLSHFHGGLSFQDGKPIWTREERPFEMQNISLYNKILLSILRIPYGHTATYGEIAKEIGSTSLARTVGQACKKNVLPVIIPCHRVIGAKSFGGYTPDISIKRFLLKLERQ